MRIAPTAGPCWRGLATAAALALLPAAAHADAGQGINYSVGASLTHDDNLLRLPPGFDPAGALGAIQKSDTFSTTSLGLVAYKEIGIQRLNLDVQVNRSRYRRFTYLDNDGHNIVGSWAWAVGHRLRGDLSFSSKESLSSFEDTNTRVRNINTVTAQSASAYLQVAPDWVLFGILGNDDSTNSATSNQAAGYASRNTETGLRYSARAGHQLSLSLRQSRSDDQVRQDNFDVRSTWVYSGLTRLSAGFGGVRRRDESGGGATSDSSGATGNLDVAWAMSPKTQFSLAARRDVEPAASNFSTNTLVRGATLGANWAPTVKTSLQFSLDRTITLYAADPSAATAPREDSVRGAGLTLSVRPDRVLSLSFSLRDETRDSNQARFSYRYLVATASAVFAF